MFGVEMKKMLRSRNARIIFLTGILLAVCQTVYYRFWYYPGIMVNFEAAMREGKGYTQPAVLLQGWLGTDFTSLWEHFFYLTIPLLAAVPWSASYHAEKRDGYLKLVYTKTSRSRYLLSKYTVTFLSGAAAVALPLLLSLYLSALYLPVGAVDAVMFQSAITNRSLWGSDFFSNPLLYALKYITLDAVYGGLFAVSSLFLSFFMKNRFSVWTLLFLLNLLGYYLLLSYVPAAYQYIPYFFLNACMGAEISGSFLVGAGIVLVGVSLGGFLFLGKKDEIF